MHEKRRRILFVSHTSEMGGAEWSLCDLIHALPRETSAVAALPRAGALSRQLARAGATVVYCPAIDRLRRAAGARALGRVLQAQWQVRRVVHEHAIDLVAANSATAALHCLTSPRPLVWHCRDLVVGPEGRWITRRARLSIAPSRASARAIGDAAPGARVALIANGVDTRRFSAIPRPPRPATNRPFLLLAVGHLVGWKGYDLLLDAVRMVHRAGVPVRLVVLGGDPFGSQPAALAAWRQCAHAQGMSSYVEFAGPVADVTPWLERADLLVHAAYPEPFGRVVVESMAAGVPVVALAGDHGPGEILQDGECGWLALRRTSEALAGSVLDALADPREMHARGQRGRLCAVARYDRKHMAARVAEAYEETIAGGKEGDRR